jgi:hypothetical protein
MAPIKELFSKILMIAKQDIISYGDKSYILKYIPEIEKRYNFTENLLFKEYERSEILRVQAFNLKDENKVLNDLYDNELDKRVKMIRKYNEAREEIIKLQREIINLSLVKK